ncbi:MAG: hypothetical protein ABEL76_05205 [Bradymonadaceae bacterium]
MNRLNARSLVTLLAAAALAWGATACSSDGGSNGKTKPPKTDTMEKDTMEKDTMQKDGMAKDGMEKDGGMPDGTTPDGQSPDGQSGGTTVKLTVDKFSPLGPGSYEGWLIDGEGNPVSTGKFDVNSEGDLLGPNDEKLDNNKFSAESKVDSPQAFVVSVEPKNDDDPAPSNTKFVAGDFSDGSANLKVSAGDAVGTDFADAKAGYILATPTNGSGSNEKSGIWFLDNSGDSPKASISGVPDVSGSDDGWQWEGWVVFQKSGNPFPVSTGKFDDPASADNAAPYSGNMSGPGFPGEDFLNSPPSGLTFPTDLSGKKVVISLEPQPDSTDKPFALKPITGDIPGDASDHTGYTADTTPELPSGEATLQ